MVILVRDIYTKPIKTIDADQPLKEAAKMMNNMGISSLIVVSEGAAVGIITERDMMRSIMLDLVNLHNVPVHNFMSTNLILVKENASIDEAIQLMVVNKIKKLPVTRAVGEVSLIGVLSMTDIIRKFPELGSRFNQLDDHRDELDNFPYLPTKG
ncbi:MAG: CBS domain-containing protein [Deltaproteobacteria bacterium]|nr:CBS domain-containing protein [Deltaproteobacteria bacterium]